MLARSSTKLLGKYSSGAIHPISWLLLLPYHVGLRVKLGVQRLVSTEPLYNKVLPGWFIGGWPWSGGELPADGPSVLDCTCELPRTHRHRYLCLPIWDTQAPQLTLIDRGVQFALAERSLGKSVYVHCAHGHGRSALLLIACLLESGEVSSWEEGLALLQSVRPKVHLNTRQRLALEAWACRRSSTSATNGCAKGGVLQMHALSASSGAAAAAAAIAAGPTAVTAAVGSLSSPCGSGGGQGREEGPQAEETVHLLAETPSERLVEQHSALSPRGLEHRQGAGHAAAAMTGATGPAHASFSGHHPAVAHGSFTGHPTVGLLEAFRSGSVSAAASAAAAAAAAAGVVVEGGKKLS